MSSDVTIPYIIAEDMVSKSPNATTKSPSVNGLLTKYEHPNLKTCYAPRQQQLSKQLTGKRSVQEMSVLMTYLRHIVGQTDSVLMTCPRLVMGQLDMSGSQCLQDPKSATTTTSEAIIVLLPHDTSRYYDYFPFYPNILDTDKRNFCDRCDRLLLLHLLDSCAPPTSPVACTPPCSEFQV